MTLKAQVEARVGTVTDTAALDQYLADASRLVIDLCPEHKLERYATIEDTVAGEASVVGKRVVAVVSSSGKRARLYPVEYSGSLTDAYSLHKATTLTPAYYLESDKVQVVPSGNGHHVYVVVYPSPANSASTITGLPPQLIPAVVLQAAIKCLSKKALTSLSGLSGLTWVVQNPLGSPDYATITYDAAVFGDYGISGWDAMPSAPTFSYTPTTLSITTQLAALATQLDTNNDAEISKLKLDEIQTRLGQFYKDEESKFADAVKDFEQSVTVYKASVERVFNMADQAFKRGLEESKQANDFIMQNAIQTLQARIASNKHILEHYAVLTQQYTAKAEESFQQYQATSQKVLAEVKSTQDMIALLSAEFAQIVNTFLGRTVEAK